MHVRTGICPARNDFSFGNKKNHMGQGLGNTGVCVGGGGGAEQLLFLSSKTP